MRRVVDIVVVGAGIVGASVAYHAAVAGADVVVLDASLPASGVTGASFAWIGGPGGRDAVDGSTPLRRAALENWSRLEREVPGVQVRWSGSLAWGEDALQDLDALGPDERVVNEAQIREVEPNLRVPPQRAVLKGTDGAVDPIAVTEVLLQVARRHGADVRLGVAVKRLRVLGLVRTLVTCPQFEARQSDGCLLVAGESAGEVTQGELRRTAEDTARRLAATFQGGQDARLIDVRVGQRPMPTDGLPIIGPLPELPGVYVAVTHSGITLGPVTGRLVAAELVEAVPDEQLVGVRPDRFRRAHSEAQPSQPSR